MSANWMGLACALLLTAASLEVRAEACRRVAPPDFRTYDYRDPAARKVLHTVESAHFKSSHRRGALLGTPDQAVGVYDNLTYTLRWFPNHPRALFLLSWWEAQVSKNNPGAIQQVREKRGVYHSARCFFERARAFAPDDANVYNSHGMFLSRLGHFDEAIQSFKAAVDLEPSSSKAHYNLGLAYFAAKRYEESAEAAKRAYELGYRKLDLARRLRAKGHWE